MGRTACAEPQCLYKGDLYLYVTYIYAKIYILIIKQFSCRADINIESSWRATHQHLTQLIPLIAENCFHDSSSHAEELSSPEYFYQLNFHLI